MSPESLRLLLIFVVIGYLSVAVLFYICDEPLPFRTMNLDMLVYLGWPILLAIDIYYEFKRRK